MNDTFWTVEPSIRIEHERRGIAFVSQFGGRERLTSSRLIRISGATPGPKLSPSPGIYRDVVPVSSRNHRHRAREQGHDQV